MPNYSGQSINKRLIEEIRNLKEADELKGFLEELLLSENAGIFRHEYKDEYKKLIRKAIKQKT